MARKTKAPNFKYTERGIRQIAKRDGWDRFIKDETDVIAARLGFVFDEARAKKSCQFFERYLRMTNGEWLGKQFTLLNWEREANYKIFGWVDANGYRRYRKVYLQLGRKNGKTSWSAGIALKMLMADNEGGPEVALVASTRDQAAPLYETAYNMAALNPQLKARLKLNRASRQIIYGKNLGSLKVYPGDSEVNLGANLSLILLDELRSQPDRRLYDNIKHSQKARRQPLFIMISTAGNSTLSLCHEVYEYACSVRDGQVIDPRFLPIVFEADKDADAGDEAQWAKANPALGEIIKVDDLRSEYEEAKARPRNMSAFRTFVLNQWVSEAGAFFDVAQWRKCSTKRPDESPMEWRMRMLAELKGQPCWLGMDLSQSRDLTALVAVFDVNDRVVVIPYCWCPARATRISERPVLEGLIEDGWIETTEGEAVDHAATEAEIMALNADYQVQELAFDPANAYAIVQACMGAGIKCTSVSQGPRFLNAPIRHLETLVLNETLDHGNNPLLEWMAGHCSVKENAAAQLILMRNQDAKKIDAIAALVDALAVKLEAPAPVSYNQVEQFFV